MVSRRSTPSYMAVFAIAVAVCTMTLVQYAPGSVMADADTGKIPITTKSEEAKKEYITGRHFAETQRTHDSLSHFDKAISLDPEFAMAELARANSAPTGNEFLAHLKRAVELADKASNGEKLLILAAQAGFAGDVTKQKEYLTQLAVAYPNDERAQFALGVFYFGQQDMGQAVDVFKKVIEIAPDFSAAYNQLGYVLRQQGNYSDSEKAFQRYIDLIPNDPNPLDSYGELLLKMGRFDESIVQYRKALSADPHFVASHNGMAADFLYGNKPAQAEAELKRFAAEARDDGQLRTALLSNAIVAADSGKFDEALRRIDRAYAVAQKKNDVGAMAFDVQNKGTILVQMGKYEAAQQQFDRALNMIETSTLPQSNKTAAALNHHYNLASLSIEEKDLKAAKAHTEAFRPGAEASANPFRLRQVHELIGRTALAEKDYDTAISELGQVNRQDPRNLYRLGLAYQGKGDKEKARDLYQQAAEFNSLPAFNYALVRSTAKKMLAAK